MYPEQNIQFKVCIKFLLLNKCYCKLYNLSTTTTPKCSIYNKQNNYPIHPYSNPNVHLNRIPKQYMYMHV